MFLNLGLMNPIGDGGGSRPNLWFNWEFEGGVSGIIGDDFVHPDGLGNQNTDGLVYCTIGTNTLEFDSQDELTRGSFNYLIQNNNVGDLTLTVGNRYEVHVYGSRIGSLPSDGGDEGHLRLLNFNNATSVEYPENGYSLTGVEADVEIGFDAMAYFDVTGADYALQIRFGQGVWDANNEVLSIDYVAIFDAGPTPILRKLLDSSGEVLTTESLEPLQHDLEMEDDMLLFDYIPNRSATDLLVSEINDDVYVNVIEFSETLIAGTYEFIVSFVVSNPDTNDSLYWQVVGDTPSPEFVEESKDSSDQEPDSFPFQYDHVGGLMTHTLQMRKEDGGANDIDILAAGIYVKRVG